MFSAADEMGMQCFAITKPDTAKYNIHDPIAPLIVASPAGGFGHQPSI